MRTYALNQEKEGFYVQKMLKKDNEKFAEKMRKEFSQKETALEDYLFKSD